MIKMKALTLALAGILAVSAFTACGENSVSKVDSGTSSSASASQSTPEGKEPGYYDGDNKVDLGTVLTIGDYEVGFDEFRYAFVNISNNLSAAGEVDEALLKQQAVDSSKWQAAIRSLSAKAGITLTDEDKKTIDEEIVIQTQMAGGEDAFKALLTQNFLTEDVFSRNTEFNILFEKYKKHLIDTKYLADITKNIEENYVHVKHVLITFPDDKKLADVTEEEKTATKKKADDAIAKINGGMSFEDAMKEFSQDPGQPEEGYYFTYGKMVPEFEEKAFALKVGEMSEAVETDYGYHIIKKYEFGTEFEGAAMLQYASDATLDLIINEINAEGEALKIKYCEEWDKINSKNVF